MLTLGLYSCYADNTGDVAEAPSQNNSKPLKAKTTKAERRALQEAQRAAKATAKG